MPRMKVFNTLEQNAYELPPTFNSIERKKYFTPSVAFNEILKDLYTSTNKVCFIVTAGYFKSRYRFFARKFNQNDIDFVAKQLGVCIDEVQLNTYSRVTYLRHQKIILEYFGFSPFDSSAKTFSEIEISRMVKVQFRPKIILLEIIQKLRRKKIVLPTYNLLANMVVTAINKHQLELNQTIKSTLTEVQKEKLDALLEQVVGTGSDDKWRYQITLLKKPFQSTRPSKIKSNITDLNDLLALYLEMKPIVDRMALSQECLRYYAYSVLKSQVHQISRRSSETRYLHLISFIVYQTFKLQDMLIDTLLLTIQGAKNETDKEYKDAYYQEREERDQAIKNLVKDLQKDFSDKISTIKGIVSDIKLTAEQKVLEIDLILKLPEYCSINVDKNIENVQKGRDYYEFLENRSLKMQNRVADIVRHTVFDENCIHTLLLEAILYYQKKSVNIDKNSPILFLTPEERIAIFDHDKKFRVSLYKALLYLAIFEAIKSGVLNVSHSEKYRSLNDYLIPKLEWEANKDEYLQRAQLSEYSDCQTTLNLIDQELDDQYKETNNHFISGENEFLKFRKDGSFHVSTPKLDETESMSLGSLFPEKRYIPLLEVLATVDHLTGFLEEFEHWQPKYKQERPQKKTFFAGIMAYGCDIGHRKLAQTSKEINENELNNTLNWYFSLANIQKANDRVLQFMNQMDLPNIYRNNDDILHTSSDGQKCEVTVDSLNSNHSFKYLGKDKGVSVMSFIDMRHMIWYSTVISSSEREAAYVIDGLMHNDVIKSDIHSTDTHGFSEMIFAVTYLLGFKFAPRIKGLGRQQLYAFSSRKETSQNAQGFKPDKYVNEKLIVPQWNEVLRFIATIKLKVATASQLFRRLNSYSKQHPLYKALKEFGKPPKTKFILKYSDDPDFRQSIEKQLNKVENSHKLGKAISICNDHAFLHGEKEDQDIAEGCRRLIKNILMAWNYTYLKTKIDEEADEERKQELINGVQKGSIMWWGHFNFNGEFDFSDEKMVDSIGLKLPKKTLAEGG